MLLSVCQAKKKEKLNETRFTNKFPFIFSISFRQFTLVQKHIDKTKSFILFSFFSSFHIFLWIGLCVCVFLLLWILLHRFFFVLASICPLSCYFWSFGSRAKETSSRWLAILHFYYITPEIVFPQNLYTYSLSLSLSVPIRDHVCFAYYSSELPKWRIVLTWMRFEIGNGIEGKLISDVIDMLCNHFVPFIENFHWQCQMVVATVCANNLSKSKSMPWHFVGGAHPAHVRYFRKSHSDWRIFIIHRVILNVLLLLRLDSPFKYAVNGPFFPRPITQWRQYQSQISIRHWNCHTDKRSIHVEMFSVILF